MRLSSLALRNLGTRKARTILTTLGVVLGVAVILAVAITNRSTIDAFRAMIDSITGKADFWVNGPSTAGFSEAKLAEVRRTPGVAVAIPGIARDSTLYAGKRRESVQVAGIDPRVDRKLRYFKLASGRFLKSDEPAALVPADLAGKKKFKLGDKVKLTGAGVKHEFKVIGLLRDEGAGRFMGGNAVFIPLKQAQSIFKLKGRLTYIDAKVKTGVSVKAAVGRVSRRLGESFIVEQPEKRAEAVSQMLKGLQVGLSFFGTIAMFVGGFLVYNTFTMVVVEQTQEMGMVRALGATRGQVVALVLIQAVVLGIIGSVLGVGAGVALAKVLMSYVSKTVELPVESISVPVLGLAGAVGVGLLVTLLAALQPALAAGRVSPLAAIRIRAKKSSKALAVLRVTVGCLGVTAGVAASFLPGPEGLGRYAYLSVSIHEGGTFLLLLGAALLSPSLAKPLGYIFAAPIRLLFGQTGKLAAANLTRNPGRTAATASAVMITLAMLMSVAGMTTSFKRSVDRWVDKSLGADVFVSGRSSDATYSKRFADKLRRVKGVKDLTMIRFVPVREGAREVLFRAIEPTSYRRFATLQFAKGDKRRAWLDLARGDHVFISTVMANKRGLKVGDKITLTTVKGRRNFTISAIAVDFGGEMGDMIVGSRKDMKKYFHLDDAGGFRLKVAAGVRPRTVADRIKKKYKSMDLDVQDIQEFKTMVDGRVTNSFAVFNVLIVLAAVVAMISVFNSLMMNILERRRELGILRAVGATRGQIGLMNLLEAFITGGIGGILGLAVGAVSARDTVNGMNTLTGYDISFIFPGKIAAIALLIALVFSVLAAAYPARRAATLEIGRALQYE
ncbi:MAG: ABC transporter permease [Actinomycetota bacterium]|nr:ABC transporter permease [Actinomycetota bacterium]